MDAELTSRMDLAKRCWGWLVFISRVESEVTFVVLTFVWLLV